MFLKIQFLFLILFLAATVATAIDPGSTLSASSSSNQTWSSPGGTFSLGFISVQPPTTPPSFIAAISYTGGDPVVWSAGHGAAVDSGGSLQFLSSGNLRLVNGSRSTVWESATAGATSAALEDNGNLVISNGTSTLWTSFDNPTDTLVQSQNFSVGKVLTSESYFFSLSGIGNLTLKWNNSIEYWTQGLNSSVNVSLESPVLSLTSIGLLELSDVNLGSPVLVAYSSDYDLNANVFRVLKLDNDGNLRIYSTSLGGGTSTVRWAAVANQCEVYAYCGNYGVCGYNDSSTVCGCPSENFEMVDPNNGRKGCRRKLSLDSCQGTATMLTFDHAVVLSYPPTATSETFFIGLSACRTNCLSSSSACFASTSLSDGTGQCVIRSIDFVSGYQDPSLPSTSYFKVCPPLAPNPPPSSAGTLRERSSKVPAWVVVVVVLGTLFVLLALEGGLWMWCCRNNKRFGALSAQYALLEYASGAPVQFSYKELQQATKGKKFSIWAYEEFERGNISAILDKRLAGQEVDMEQVRRAIQASFWCIQEQPSQRPTMSRVLQMLEGVTEVEKPPAPKSVMEGTVSGTSTYLSSNASAFSTVGVSPPGPSSTSSFQISGVSTFNSGRTPEKATSSLLQSDT
ncbi:G-type lectin S-receptor-like serine/threonine-protein [Vigna angularis]|uniref:non-specific serine/threonine protein kinase n=1 Tax=Phaseolus angularis TaxID=3914 RepID=A0A8T0JY25_PHAAN|nr:G-type lectin S-receptor-like serine/threonine-protein [Vigna angularis]